MDISDILKKYRNKEDDPNTLKHMCKSKSGFLYTQSNMSGHQKYSPKYPSEVAENFEGRYQADEFAFNPRIRTSSK